MDHRETQSDRRQVTILFTDMVGYTAIVAGLGEERAVGFTKMIYDMLSSVVKARGGTVRGFAGDSIMAVFGIPEALEDAALRSCRTALAIHAAFEETADSIETRFGVRPKMRVGICSGSAVMASVEGEGAELTAVGNTVNLASRIQSLAPEGGSLICDTSRRLVEWQVDHSFGGTHEIKGVTGSQKLWQLHSIKKASTRFDASLARGLSDYVGRKDELTAMADALESAGKGLRVVDLVAEPGLGKTRLVFEFLERATAQNVTVLAGHCSTDGQQVPFFPFLEVLRRSFRLRDNDDPDRIIRLLTKGLQGADLWSEENLGLLLNLLGLEPPDGALQGLDGVLIGLRTRDLFPALLAAQCREGPVILHLEDVHWLDSASEELVRKLMQQDNQSNLLVIQTRRPEYVPTWPDAGSVTKIALMPLSDGDIVQIAQKRLGARDLPEALIQQVTERAGGNPLFAEEIVAFLRQEGAITVTEGVVEFDADLGATSLPLSMQGLLTARIDRLQPEQRNLLQAAAAIGRRFAPALLSVVLGHSVDLDLEMQRLRDLDIVYRDHKTDDFAFKHVLLRETVYQGLLSQPRTDLHLAIASAVQERAAGRLIEVAETLAYHYSLTERRDLAFQFAAMAGAKSLGIFSLGEANRYLTSALKLYEHDPTCASDVQYAALLADYALCSNVSLRVKTMMKLADQVRPFLNAFGDSPHHVHFLHHYVSCLIWNGRYLDAIDVQHELSQMASRLGDRDTLAYAIVSELVLSCYTGTLSSDAFEAKRVEAEQILDGLDDAYLQNFFLAHIGWNAVCRGRVGEAQDAAEQMVLHGRKMNDPRSLGYGVSMKALIALASDDHQQAFEISEQARLMSRVQFEITIADAAHYAAMIPLEIPGAAKEVQAYCDRCAERGWTLFASTTDTMMGVALAIDGKIDEGLRRIEVSIAKREQEGFQIAADWYRLFLSEVYLEILSGEGDASMGVLFRNIRSLSKVMLRGGKLIPQMIEKACANPMFDPNGHHIGRAEMILGLLYKIKKKQDLARKHLTEAQRIVAPTGPSPMLTRIEDALAELT
ncbi:Adenylate and Guanylate cyclase catalytic domain-containing protein [Shimia gijangensis]|uniref:Adenylate and Guanylate cyclase catalytic domain-containing protein n=1 Tax=Shimia gijangensis TaxID=1470563 RepID=A0A1M6TPW4_9RHOB|nr:AAA family ATPase [Shimia gijangensis]SHK58984.1 Adenylate and Guanylate cyclase catalytic domain-containing protein [Shimia gijangensis]